MTPTPEPTYFLVTPTAMFGGVNLTVTPVLDIGPTSFSSTVIQGYNTVMKLEGVDFLWIFIIILLVFGAVWMITKAVGEME